jgi:tetratricopeptide (TPR) repeat protein
MNQLVELAWSLKDAAALEEAADALEKILDEAISNEPDNCDLIFNHGNAHAVEMAYLQLKMGEDPMLYGPRMGETALKAINCFNKVLEKNPQDDAALLTRAFWQFHSPGCLEKARGDFGELVKRAKERGIERQTGEQAFLGMAMTCRKAGQLEEAGKLLEEGLRLYPGSETLRKELQQAQERE